MQKYIYQFVKGKGSRRTQNVGVLMATKVDDGIIIATSKAAVSRGDRFKKNIALHIAKERIEKFKNSGFFSEHPLSFEDDITMFEDRCRRYFKTDNIINNY